MLELIKYHLSKIIYSDMLFDKIRYFLKFYKFLNTKNPSTFNEKLIWKKYNDINPLSSKVVDKYLVRDYVLNIDNTILLPDIYSITNNMKKVDFSILPKQFIVKATHGSGWNSIIMNKNTINEKNIKKICKRWLSMNYYYKGREKVYKYLVPKIMFEELLLDEEGNVPNDIKCFCFNGNVEFIQVDLNRYSNHKRAIFNKKWDKQPVVLQYPIYKKDIPKPKCLDRIIEVAEKLSKKFDFIRVDLYIIDNDVYFGELTNYPGCGLEKFNPGYYDKIFGDMLNLKNDQ